MSASAAVHNKTGACGARLGVNLIVDGVEIVGDVAVSTFCSCSSVMVFSTILRHLHQPLSHLRAPTCQRSLKSSKNRTPTYYHYSNDISDISPHLSDLQHLQQRPFRFSATTDSPIRHIHHQRTNPANTLYNQLKSDRPNPETDSNQTFCIYPNLSYIKHKHHTRFQPSASMHRQHLPTYLPLAWPMAITHE